MTASAPMTSLIANLPFILIEGHPRSNALSLLGYLAVSLLIPLLAHSLIDRLDHTDALWYAVWLIPTGLMLAFIYFLALVYPLIALLVALMITVLIVVMWSRKSAKRRRRLGEEQYYS